LLSLVENINLNKIIKREGFFLEIKKCDTITLFVKPLSLSCKASVNGKDLELSGTSVLKLDFDGNFINMIVTRGKFRIEKICAYKVEHYFPYNIDKFDFTISGVLI